jgi:hypothetical protein
MPTTAMERGWNMYSKEGGLPLVLLGMSVNNTSVAFTGWRLNETVPPLRHPSIPLDPPLAKGDDE